MRKIRVIQYSLKTFCVYLCGEGELFNLCCLTDANETTKYAENLSNFLKCPLQRIDQLTDENL